MFYSVWLSSVTYPKVSQTKTSFVKLMVTSVDRGLLVGLRRNGRVPGWTQRCWRNAEKVDDPTTSAGIPLRLLLPAGRTVACLLVARHRSGTIDAFLIGSGAACLLALGETCRTDDLGRDLGLDRELGMRMSNGTDHRRLTNRGVVLAREPCSSYSRANNHAAYDLRKAERNNKRHRRELLHIRGACGLAVLCRISSSLCLTVPTPRA
ncbi:hypothetical protein F4803DRAFT_162457 [Xylaria telfairii]|nr:hypothetical protein F4803DRAFT_162457 [Xylaria telfairii]